MNDYHVLYSVFQKNWTTKLIAVTLSNLNRFLPCDAAMLARSWES